MSPERVPLDRAPTSARILDEGTEVWLARELAAREDAAHLRGVEEGAAAARSGAARALDEALAELATARSEAASGLAASAVELATAIARELLRVEVDAGRHDIETMARNALAVADTGRASCVLHLNPADVEALVDVPFRAGTELQADMDVQRGHVRVSTPHGLLVRDLDTAVDGIREHLLEELRGC